MFAMQSDVFDVPTAAASILQDRATSSYQRTLVFHNLSAGTLAITTQYSAAGGEAWTDIETFNLAAGAMVVKNVTRTEILRVRASGGGDDRDLAVALFRVDLDARAEKLWTTPRLP